VTIAEVRNRTKRTGLAAQTVTTLSAMGFAGSLKPGTGPAGPVSTEIRYPAGQQEAARTLAGLIAGSRIIEDPTLSGGLVVVLGASFTGVTGVPKAPAEARATARPPSPAGVGPALAGPTGPTILPPSSAPTVTPADTSCTP
jgi:hypothetical protein